MQVLRKLFILQRGYVLTSKLGYSIMPAQRGVGDEVTIMPATLPTMVPPLTEANKGRLIVVNGLFNVCVCVCAVATSCVNVIVTVDP